MKMIYVCTNCHWEGTELLSLESTRYCPGCMEPVVLPTPAPAPRPRTVFIEGKDGQFHSRCQFVSPTGKQCRGYAIEGDSDQRCGVHAKREVA